MPRPLLFALFLLAAGACKKDAPRPEPIPAGGSWIFNGQEHRSRYCDINTRDGYELRFYDSLGTNNISFLFRQRPAGVGTLTPAPDTSRAQNVYIHLETGNTGYHSGSGSGGGVNIELPDNKLFLDGDAIALVPDSTGTAGSVSFSLRQY